MIQTAFAQGGLETELFALQILLIAAGMMVRAFSRGRLASSLLAGLALAAAMAATLIRSLDAGRLPFASMYEFGLLLSIALDALLLWVHARNRERSLPLAASAAAFIGASLTLLLFQKAHPLAPSLKSAWLVAHVSTAVIAYALLGLGAAYGLAGLLAVRKNKDWSAIEASMNRLLGTAFPFLTLLIVTGAVWAEYAWGSFWRWDPKETWALITWIAYLSYLHLIHSRRWTGAKAFTLSLICFGLVLFSFFGVNLLLPGMHSYAR